MLFNKLNENYNNWSREDYINELKRLGYNYKFDKYTTDQLYNIVNKNNGKFNKLNQSNNKFKFKAKLINDKEFEQKDGNYIWNGVEFPSYEEMIEYQKEQEN